MRSISKDVVLRFGDAGRPVCDDHIDWPKFNLWNTWWSGLPERGFPPAVRRLHST